MLDWLIIILVVAWFAKRHYDEKHLKPISRENKAVLITGAASGLGKQLATQLLEKGCFVYATDLSLASLETAFANVKNKSNVTMIKMDVTKQSDVDEAVAAVKADGRPLFGIVCSAGLSVPPGTKSITLGSIAERDLDNDIRPIYEVNVFGTMRTVHGFFPLLLKTAREGSFGEPCIALISSILGILSTPGSSAYGSGKHAIYSYADSLRRELEGTGVRVICFEPGFTATPLAQDALALPIDDTKTIITEKVAKWREGAKKLRAQTTFQPVDFVTNVMEKAMFNTPSRPHYLIDTPIKTALYKTMSLMPTDLLDFLIAKM